MPRRSSGPKLWFDKARNTWTIVDGRIRRRTGFRADEAAKAQGALRHYLAEKHQVEDNPNPKIADVLAVYSEEKLAGKKSESHILYDIAKLTKWWGGKWVTDINSKSCREYAKHRKAFPCARRELTFLGAAVRYWDKEHGPLKSVPTLTLPAPSQPRQHWMTRSQAAKFLWHARRSPHLARFFIIGWYTGSRRTVICNLRWDMIDFKTRIMQRLPHGVPDSTNKKAPPVRMGQRLMAHLKRWQRMDGKGAEFVITYRGKPIVRPTEIWNIIRAEAKLPTYITPHILRHTRATNMMQQRKDPWEAAKALGMSLEMLTKVYGHHHPDWQKDVSETR